MAKKKPETVLEIVKKIDEMLLGSNDAGLAAINRVEKKLDAFIDYTKKELGLLHVKLQRQEEEDEDYPEDDEKPKKSQPWVILAYPNRKKSKKDLPVLYYQGVIVRPGEGSKCLWTKELDKAARDLQGTMGDILIDIEDDDGLPEHYLNPELETLALAQRDVASEVEDDE